MAHAHEEAHEHEHEHEHEEHAHEHGHGHGHEHGHEHEHEEHAHEAGHGHGLGASPQGKAFAVGIGLNLVFVIVEVIYGLAAHSMALVADAAHNLSDVLGLSLAWGATVLAKRRPSSTRTYGLRGTTILAALTNALLLFVAVGGVIWEAVQRLMHPAYVAGWTVIVVAAVGVAVNGTSALFFMKGSKHDVNVRGAFLHLASDAVVSLAVVITGAILLRTGWLWLDPAASIAVSIVILIGTWSLLRQSLDLALHGVPAHIDLEAVRTHLERLPGVREVHDLHVWAMSTTETALTAHLVMDDPQASAFLRELSRSLRKKFRIQHVTCQVECDPSVHPCELASEDVV